MIIQYFKIAAKNLRARSLRSWLTIMGIVIGIFLVISLLALSGGLKQSIMSELRMMGGNIILITPGEDMIMGMMAGLELSDRDIKAIRRSKGVDSVIAMPWDMEVVRHQDSAESTILFGISLEGGLDILQDDMGWETTEGEFPRPGRREALVGHLVPRDIFPEMRIGDEIRVQGRRFTVSGALRSLGNRQDDSMIMLDLSDYRAVTGDRDGASVVMARAMDDFDVNSVVQNIEDSLQETRKRVAGQDSPPFSVIASDTASDMVEGVMGILQVAVFAFASIAILVGGIGIMNTMFTSVKERTREIGILKAVGAKKKHIVMIFLFESGIIGLIGGIGGVILGIFLSKGVEFALAQNGAMIPLEAYISPSLVLFGLSFSFIIGCISGYFPARGAAKLQPVDALRYE